MDTLYECTSHSGRIGIHISCGGWQSAPQTFGSSSPISLGINPPLHSKRREAGTSRPVALFFLSFLNSAFRFTILLCLISPLLLSLTRHIVSERLLSWRWRAKVMQSCFTIVVLMCMLPVPPPRFARWASPSFFLRPTWQIG